MENRQIQLTEQDLHFLVEDAVRNYLKEQRIDEFWGGMGSMLGGAKNAIQQKYGQAKQGMQNLGQNMANSYRQGNINAKIQKQGQWLLSNLKNFANMAQNANNNELSTTVANCLNQIQQVMTNSSQRTQNVQNNTFSTKRYQSY